MARHIIGEDFFPEVFVSTALEVCDSRDPKGLYSKVRAGQVSEFTGISSPYEAPKEPDLVIDTNRVAVENGVLLLTKLISRI